MSEKTTIQIGTTTWSGVTADETLADIAACMELIERNKDNDELGAVLVNPGEEPLESFLESRGIQVNASSRARGFLSFHGVPIFLSRTIKAGDFLPVPKRLMPDRLTRFPDSVCYRLSTDAQEKE